MVKDSSYTLAGVRVGEEDGIPFVETEGTEDFDLRAVMECGQCFRFTPVAGTSHRCEYSGVAHGHSTLLQHRYTGVRLALDRLFRA